MSIKEFTLQQGFILPILKSLTILKKDSSIKEILDCLTTKNLCSLLEGDLEKIDFNGKIRFHSAVENAINVLVQQGLVVFINNAYKISEKGARKLDSEWTSYNQNMFTKKVDILNKNKYIYFNIPPYLLHDGHKQVSVPSFNENTQEYVRFINDLIDYIDLNYPSIEEMINFLKQNYDFEDNNSCLNVISVVRSCALAKVVGKNLSLTKLGQWYINSYDNIALFKIFANRFTGFEEIFNSIAVNNGISKENLKHNLSSQYNLNWTDSSQYDIRLSWLENMEIIENNNSGFNLSSEATDLAEYLGIIDIKYNKTTESGVVIEPKTSKTINDLADTIIEQVSEDDFYFSHELDNIIDDLISESVSLNDLSDNDDEFIESDILKEPDKKVEASQIPENEMFNKNINLSQQERNFLLNNIDVDSNIFMEDSSSCCKNINTLDEYTFEIADLGKESIIELEESIEELDNFQKEESSQESDLKQHKQSPVVIKIPTKCTEQDKIISNIINDGKREPLNMYINPEEISGLVNLPNEIICKIASALNMGKHLILTGPHGSGKTSIAVVLAKIAHQKNINNGYNLTSATEHWTSFDTIGGLMDDYNSKKVFKEGFILKSVRENKWLIIDEISKCDTYKCFNDFINSFYGHNTILSYIHENYKNIEIINEPLQDTYEVNQYVKNRDWRIIATMDTLEKHHMNFLPAFIRRFAFIEIGVNNYSSLIDEYFLKNNLQNDLLKTKIKSIFSENGLLKFKDVGASSIYDLIQYISIRSKLLSEEENIQDILAEGLELYILPQLQVLDDKIIKEVQTYLIDLFDGYEKIKNQIRKAL